MGSVGVLLGQMNGVFGEQRTFSTGNGSQPNFITTGDVNKDNQLDLAIVRLGTSSICVLLGNRDGTFEAPKISSTANIPVSLATGDFNKDGHLDIATANQKSLNIGVLLGNGDGTFGVETTFRLGNPGYPNSIVVEDFNKDGALDLAVSNGPLNNVAILLNNGNGYFYITSSFSTGPFSNPNSIAVGDFNNDSRLDLAIVNSGQNNVGILLGKENERFADQMTFSTDYYSYPYSIIVGDFNNDRHQDVVVSNIYARTLGILLGIGNGTFLSQMTLPIGTNSTLLLATTLTDVLISVASGDFNGDGRLDLIYTDVLLNNVGVLLNSCQCCIPELVNNNLSTYR